MALARATIFFPTRRATRGFRSVLATVLGEGNSGNSAFLMPRLIPIGDVEDAEIGIALTGSATHIPPAIEPLRRRMLLTKLVSAWAKAANRDVLGLPESQPLMPQTAGDAFALSRELAALIDEFCIHDVSFDQLAGLDASGFDKLWDLNVRFLGIAATAWPALLAERNVIDAAARRNRLIAQTCALLADEDGPLPLAGPFIAAGSTGSIPATARLLATIASHPQGAVILPDLDKGLDEPSWDALVDDSTGPEAAHPQSTILQFLSRIGATRQQVRSLHGPSSAARSARRDIIREALRPVATTDQWATLSDRLPGRQFELGLADVTIIDARDEREEALAIAVVLREALENQDCIAALVTPDRGLATRVATELRRWNISVDDSAGLAVARTPVGALACLVLDCVVSGYAAAPVLALLAHPSVTLGLTREEVEQASTVLEIGALRGAVFSPGMPSLLASIQAISARQSNDQHPPLARRRITVEQIEYCGIVMERLKQAFAPLNDACLAGSGGGVALAELANPHRQVLENLTSTDVSVTGIWADEAGQSLLRLLDHFHATAEDSLVGELADYIDIFGEMARETMVRQAWAGHPRVKILGLLEARLLEADMIVMGGLTETSWPPAVDAGAFLNRTMRAQLGLSPPERRIGQTAHDFSQCFSAARIAISKAGKATNKDTIPSRFWQRLKAICPVQTWESATQRGDIILAHARCLDAPSAAIRIQRPSPIVPARLQPLRFSATAIETLYRDPYQIYARRILKLDELEPLAISVGARDRGTILHQIIEQLSVLYPALLPADFETELDAIAHTAFAPLMHEIEVATFWWPQWLRMRDKLIAWEMLRRIGLHTILTEETASAAFPLADGSGLEVSSRIDQIELKRDGTIRIVDFKTGRMPSPKEIKAGLAAQLLIGVALAKKGGIRQIGTRTVSEASYVRLAASGLEERSPSLQEMDSLDAVAQEHMRRLVQLLLEYRQGKRGFASRIVPMRSGFDGPYDHLARAAEWSLAGDGDADGDQGGS